jgi:Cu(I)/Ag(I) efflux system membrane protein CusA/SilA
VSTAIGGETLATTEVVQGRERHPINVRYPREIRDSLERLRQLPFVTEKGATVLLQDVARISIEDGPPMLRSENARLSGWVYVDVRGRDLRSVVNDMQAAVAKQVVMPAGYAVSWSGQFEYLERATERLKLVVPVTLAVIFVLLYLLFRSFIDAALVMAAVPFSLVGGFWLVWALGHSISVASAVGFIALAGVAAEFGVVMLIYLKNAHTRRLAAGEPDNEETLVAAIREGAVLRVRPKAMTVAIVLAGLIPMMWGHGTGSEVMARIAAPMVGGMVTAPLLSMLVVPAAWYLLHRRRGAQRVRAAVPIAPSLSNPSTL